MRPKSLRVLVIVAVFLAAQMVAITPSPSFAGTTVSVNVPSSICLEIPSNISVTLTPGEPVAGLDRIKVQSNTTWSIDLDSLPKRRTQRRLRGRIA